jgi:type III secretion protein T
MSDILQLYQIAHSAEEFILLIALCSIRILAAFTILPATGEQALQGSIRTAISVLIGAYMAAGMTDVHIELTNGMQWVGMALKEALIGLVLGYMASTVFWTAESVGALIDAQAGYNNVQLTNPLSGEQSTPVSGLLLQLVIALFHTLGGMLVFIGLLFDTFRVWPLQSALPTLAAGSEAMFLADIDRFFAQVVKFAAPVLLVLVLIDVSFGLMTKAADKLEPSSLSQPVKGAVTMLLLALMCGIIFVQVRHFLVPSGLLDRLLLLVPKG